MSAADAIVVSAGPAGSATAQQFRVAGLTPVILDKADAVGAIASPIGQLRQIAIGAARVAAAAARGRRAKRS